MYNDSYGIKLCSNMRETLLDKILNYNGCGEQRLLFTIGSIIGFNKFKTIDDLKNNIDKFGKILKNESAFNGNLGLSLLQFFNLKPKKILIYEDKEGTGREIKERTEDGEKLLHFIPIFCDENQFSVDDDIKDFNNLAENKYDIIEGRYLN